MQKIRAGANQVLAGTKSFSVLTISESESLGLQLLNELKKVIQFFKVCFMIVLSLFTPILVIVFINGENPFIGGKLRSINHRLSKKIPVHLWLKRRPVMKILLNRAVWL